MAVDSNTGTRRTGLSFEHKLPLLITFLLIVTTAVGLTFAYVEVKQSAVESATERLQLVSQQLSSVVAPGIPQRIDAMREVARAPSLRDFIEDRSEASRAAAEAALDKLQPPGTSDAPIVLLTADRERVLQLGRMPAAAGDSSLPGAVWTAFLTGAAGVSPFFAVGDSAYYALQVPIGAGGSEIGYIVEVRTVGGARTARQVESLIGRDVSVFFANSVGRLWIALDGTLIPAPGDWPFIGAANYEADGAAHISHAVPIPGTSWTIVTEQPMETILARPRSFMRHSGVAAILLCLTGAASAWLLSRGITNPVKQLRRASEAIALGNYDQRINLNRTDEFGILADSFDRMAAQVETTHGELERSNRRLELAIDAAESARHDAEVANRVKSEFLATMSHEIRTPINAIVGYTDLLQLGLSGPLTENQRGQLERIRVSGRHLIGLVDQVLDFARIEAGTIQVETRVASVADAVETALTVVRPQATTKGVEIATGCQASSDVAYLGDPQRVDQIVVNLLTNAIKFTEPGGRITIECMPCDGTGPADAASGQWARLVVEDTGAGIPPERLEHVFEPFVQLESGYTRRSHGVGLGLAISLRLARSMGGDLSVDSEVAQGSRFTLWLPAA